MIVLPAIIPKSFEDLENHLIQVKDLVRTVQIDICDGRLSPSPSWPYIGDDREFKEILAQDRGLPHWESFDFEIDLMVLNPVREYEQWIDAGVARIIFHYKESLAEELKEIMQKTKDRGVEVGLALHMHDPLEVVSYFKDLSSIQLMGIDHIGLQGQPFDEQVIARVKKVKELYPDIPVGVDGGVNFDTAQSLVDAGVDRLVVGSAIFQDTDVAEAIGYFESLV